MADIGVADLEKNANEPKNIQELTQYVRKPKSEVNLDDSSNSTTPVQSLLQNMQDKFQQISDQILNRIDDMGNRVDDLEKNIADLMTQAGAAPTPGFDPPTGPNH